MGGTECEVKIVIRFLIFAAIVLLFIAPTTAQNAENVMDIIDRCKSTRIDSTAVGLIYYFTTCVITACVFAGILMG